ncbi:hypothetical protein PACTADRAFT_49066 [Pachysolen tannophilus NRRL Y-2460]|uniref:Uncharacterized protein n=1 Tax=Pachysolen tannophilus NRRL Y-2460 TaxID=669874 RepID=A0A1E4U022_PACTA|nr:hypothetical protein PACTADRAFT_49066 [Pachysolen tannophilus NRRL Y-2460]
MDQIAESIASTDNDKDILSSDEINELVNKTISSLFVRSNNSEIILNQHASLILSSFYPEIFFKSLVLLDLKSINIYKLDSKFKDQIVLIEEKTIPKKEGILVENENFNHFKQENNKEKNQNQTDLVIEKNFKLDLTKPKSLVDLDNNFCNCKVFVKNLMDDNSVLKECEHLLCFKIYNLNKKYLASHANTETISTDTTSTNGPTGLVRWLALNQTII